MVNNFKLYIHHHYLLSPILNTWQGPHCIHGSRYIIVTMVNMEGLKYIWGHTFMVSTWKRGASILIFVTCLWILLFLNNKSIVHFCVCGHEGRGHKIIHFVWKS